MLPAFCEQKKENKIYLKKLNMCVEIKRNDALVFYCKFKIKNKVVKL